MRLIIYVVTAIPVLILLMLILLNVGYSILEKKQNIQKESGQSAPYRYNFPEVGAEVNNAKEVVNLIPVPRKVTMKAGYFVIPSQISYFADDSVREEAAGYLQMAGLPVPLFKAGNPDIAFRYDPAIQRQGYTMEISPSSITVRYSDRQGMYYSIITVKVLRHNYSGVIPCAVIADYSDLETRGVMLDISRDKVPEPETLKGIVQLLADLKYNHFELYIEGFSFAYPSFRELWEGRETPVTGEEILELDRFCRERFIDLVPNQNTLGHMMSWLATERYSNLAECPKGYKLMGLVNMKGTMDPVDPGTLDLVVRMTDDLLPNFSSEYYNVNLDEPFELGKGKNKKLAGQKGVGQIYLDYALKLDSLSKKRNKKMMMWADIVMKHPDLIPGIPKDITLLDWGYEASYPFERHAQTLHDAGLTFMVCPGTNSWTTITGRTDNMLATIESAAVSGKRHGAKGLLLTDWGDMGHWQYLPVSYAGYVTGAALSWNSASGREIPLADFLSKYVFSDKKEVMGKLVLDLGRYNRFEEFPMLNMTTTMMALQLGLRDEVMVNAIFDSMISGVIDLMNEIAPETTASFVEAYRNRHDFDFEGLSGFLDSREKLLATAHPGTADSTVIRDEYTNAIRLIRLGTGLKSYIANRQSLGTGEQKEQLIRLKDLCKTYLEENKRLWLLRNKPGGYDRSIASLESLMNQFDDRIALLDKPALSIKANRFLERAIAAGTALYLRYLS